jgi:hypothetical protein
MVDFNTLLSKPTGEAERPKPLPAGDYPAVIKRWEAGDANKNRTPYVRFTIGLTGLPEDADPSDYTKSDGSPLDISKASFRSDFYMTEEAQYRLDEFMKAGGLEMGRPYNELLNEMIGTTPMAKIGQRMDQTTNAIYNQVDNLYFPAA